MFLKRLLFSLVMLCIVLCVDAQGKHKRFTPERFQAELEQYIVEKACLTPKEASVFFRFTARCATSKGSYTKS